jgi:N-acetylmuramoyl-L-alanine amidase
MRMFHRTRPAAAALATALTLAAFGCAGNPAAPRSSTAPIVAVDVGHSPTRPGTISARGIPEHAHNRKLAQDLLAQLHADGYTQSFLIRATDKTLSLEERAEAAVDRGADLLISVHHDSVQPHYLEKRRAFGRMVGYSKGISGYSLFCSGAGGAAPESLRLATEIGRQLRTSGLTPSLHHAEEIPGESRDLVDAQLGVYRFDELVLLRTTGIPSVLFEAGVIVDRDEERRLAKAGYRKRIAQALSRGVTVFAPPPR